MNNLQHPEDLSNVHENPQEEVHNVAYENQPLYHPSYEQAPPVNIQQIPSKAEVDALRTEIINLYSQFETFGRKVEQRLLDVIEPNWRKVTESPGFIAWSATLPLQDRDLLLNTWNASIVSAGIRKFHAHQEASHTKTNKVDRLERSITPKGVVNPTSAVSDDDAFSIGFRSVRGGPKTRQ